MERFEKQEETMYRLLEIYDAYETLQDISDLLTGLGCSAGYGEGVLGKLSHIVRLIIDHADPLLYDKEIDFSGTKLAQILGDKDMDNRNKAEILTGSRK